MKILRCNNKALMTLTLSSFLSSLALFTQSASSTETTQPQQKKPASADEIRLRMELGEAKLGKRDLDGALAEFNVVVANDPKDKWAYNNRGLAYLYKRDFDKAISDFNSALGLDPSFQQPLVSRSDCYLEQNKLEQAVADCTRVIDIDKTTQFAATAYNNRGLALLRQEKSKEALDDYNAAVAINPKYALALVGRAGCEVELKKYDEAMADYNQVISVTPGYAKAYKGRAYLKSLLSDNKGAIDDYSKAIELDPGSSFCYEHRGKLKEAQGDHDGAVQDLAAALKLAQPGNHSVPPPPPSTAMTPEESKNAAEYFQRVCAYIKTFWKPLRLDSPNRASVRFDITKTGDLVNAHISKSSGDKLCDEAALVAVEKAAAYAPPPPGLPDPVPIEFSFNDNLTKKAAPSPSTEQPNPFSSSKLTDEQMKLAYEYVSRVQAFIKTFWRAPKLAGTERASVLFSLGKEGDITGARLSLSSGNKQFDDAALAAVTAAKKYSPPPACIETPFKIDMKFNENVH